SHRRQLVRQSEIVGAHRLQRSAEDLTLQMADPGQIIHGYALDKDQTLAGDVVVIGTGAGGGVAAEIFAKAGLKVILLEAGGYKTAKDFHMNEAEAYTALYYDVASRKTKDKAINV